MSFYDLDIAEAASIEDMDGGGGGEGRSRGYKEDVNPYSNVEGPDEIVKDGKVEDGSGRDGKV